jgi:thiol-disulfide isomerase/thioredoxin
MISFLIMLAPAIAEPLPEDAMKPMPQTPAGEDVLGDPLPLDDLRWIAGNAETVIDSDKVTLVRWWTNACPFCESSLPAINDLEREYGDRGFQTVAVYHPKPPRDVPNDTVIETAKRIGFDGPIAVDDDWAVLRRAYLDTGKRGATSVSFLLDAGGAIRYVHPGPELRPSKDDPALQAQYDEMREAIEALLAEKADANAE